MLRGRCSPVKGEGLVSYSASTVIAAPRAQLMLLLRRVDQLPRWNPAISAVRTRDIEAVTGRAYPAVIRGLLPATLTYDRQTSTEVAYTLSGLGASEAGRWTLVEESPGRTRVIHEFEHRGALLHLLRANFAPVAAWRVGRLRQVAEAAVAAAR